MEESMINAVETEETTNEEFGGNEVATVPYEMDYSAYEKKDTGMGTGLKVALSLLGLGIVGGGAYIGHKVIKSRKNKEGDEPQEKISRKEAKEAKKRAEAIKYLEEHGYEVYETGEIESDIPESEK